MSLMHQFKMADSRVFSFFPSLLLVVLLFLWAPPVQSYPDGGRIDCPHDNFNTTAKTASCSKSLALQTGGLIFVKLNLTGGKSDEVGNIEVKVEKAENRFCEFPCSVDQISMKFDKSGILQVNDKSKKQICGPTTPEPDDNTDNAVSQSSFALSQSSALTSSTSPSPSPTQTPSSTQSPSPTPSPPEEQSSRRRDVSTRVADDNSHDVVSIQAISGNWDTNPDTALYEVGLDEVYRVTVDVSGVDVEQLNISITLMNPYGYLDAADYPAMVFYSVMLVVYVSLAVVWSVLLCCSYKDLIRLQFFIAVAILLGVLEKAFFVAEYAYVNEHGISISGSSTASPFSSYLVIAEGVSALKKTFARVLLIIVSLGYGTVIPRLGGMLKWVVLFGVAFFLATSVDGLTRAFYYVTREGLPNSVMIAFIPQLVMDVIFIYWIINAIVNTRRTLRLRRNIKKLAFYNHLLYTFMFAVIGIAAFCVWFYVSGFLHRCEDLQSLWLKECFWHIIFTVLLIVIMILWRPSSNALRYAYSLVHDADEEEVEQKVNKNLETMSRRQRTKGDEVVPPKPSHDMEEDLKWVEENLPTSTIDQVLQPLVDSDEDELMTSRFELSKMD